MKLKTAVKIVLPILLITVLVIALFWGFSPKMVVTRTFKKAVKAFETVDAERTLSFVSDDYEDTKGNTKGDMESVLPVFFQSLSSAVVMLSEMDIDFDENGAAHIIVEGQIIFKKDDDTMFRIKSEDPFEIVMIKEDKEWKIVTVIGVGLSDLEMINEEF